MGNWRITIDGIGMHHNGTQAIMKDGTIMRGGVPSDQIDQVVRWESAQPGDANVMYYKFIESLKLMGHIVNQASFECLGQIEYYHETK